MKYIRMNMVDIIMFPGHLNHKVMADQNGGQEKCTSAGFVRDTEFGLECFGHSESLELDSHLGDTKLLKIALRVK